MFSTGGAAFSCLEKTARPDYYSIENDLLYNIKVEMKSKSKPFSKLIINDFSVTKQKEIKIENKGADT